jgi:2'-hydroxyisoflavone reductase
MISTGELRMIKRRELLQWTAALAALPRATRADTTARAGKPLEILFLGGTGFLGPHQVGYALARGHRVTLFNRGQSAAGLYRDRAEILVGDRDTKVGAGLDALRGEHRWDVVIDNSGYVPRHVRDSVELLRDRTGRYVYVSTVAVYDFAKGPLIDERSALAAAPSPPTEEVNGTTYGPLKAECDRIVQGLLGERATIVRPTYVVGPGDDTDRFTYWVERCARGGEVLGPPDPQAEIQWVDVRDLCPWIVDLAERNQPGIFNAAGPAKATHWGVVLPELAKLAPQPATFHWATPEALSKAGINRLPLVRGPVKTGGAMEHFKSDAAQAAGLRYRPLADTAAATLAWWQAQSADRRAKAENWPTREQEARALQLMAAQ